MPSTRLRKLAFLLAQFHLLSRVDVVEFIAALGHNLRGQLQKALILIVFGIVELNIVEEYYLKHCIHRVRRQRLAQTSATSSLSRHVLLNVFSVNCTVLSSPSYSS